MFTLTIKPTNFKSLAEAIEECKSHLNTVTMAMTHQATGGILTDDEGAEIGSWYLHIDSKAKEPNHGVQ